MSSSTAIQVSAIEKVSQAIEAAVAECGIERISGLPAFMQAVKMAQGISALRAALTDQFVAQAIMPLQGSKLGFLTDKDKEGGYGIHVVREASIEAMLRGFSVVGNEFNIIAGGFYGAKAGFARKVLEFPGLTDLVLEPGVPQLIADKGALVPYTATWRLDGKPMVMACEYTKEGEKITDRRIPVKVNAGMGTDAVLGKAERKLFARIFQRLNGNTFGLVDGEVGDEPIVTTGEPAPSPVPEGTPEGKRVPVVRLSGKRGPAPAAAEPTPAPASETKATEPKAADPKPEGGAIPISRPRRQPAQDLPLTWPAVQAVLALADPAWYGEAQLTTIMGWTPEQMRLAHEWARAFNDKSVEDKDLPARPHFTVLGRDPGQEG
jgi:hypothetical protein